MGFFPLANGQPKRLNFNRSMTCPNKIAGQNHIKQGQQQALKHPHNPAYIDLYWILIK